MSNINYHLLHFTLNIRNLLPFLLTIFISAFKQTSSSYLEIPVLTSRNITYKINKYDLVLLEFVSSSCNLCVYLERTLLDFKTQVNRIAIEYNKTIYIAKINIENDDEMREKYGVYKFPSLSLLNNNYETKVAFPLDTMEATVAKLLSFVET